MSIHPGAVGRAGRKTRQNIAIAVQHAHLRRLIVLWPLAGVEDAVFVLGKSSWNGEKIPTTRLLEELCAGLFALRDSYWYPLRNRYMSYSRQNDADIGREHVLVLRKL